MKLCIIIPVYNHGSTLDASLEKLSQFNLPVIIVDDGSDQQTKSDISYIKNKYNNITILELEKNSGKGAAMMKGFEYAYDHGYTHALQIDADGQHDINDINKFIEYAKKYPNDLISGKPVYDDSVPKSRLYGRKITDFWVMLETWSRTIKDSMCGYRVYPLEQTVKLISSTNIGKRMDFDIDIIVRLYWKNVDIKFIPTKVIYPEDGISHFKLLRDNFVITKMHTKLFFSMLYAMPKKLFCKKRHWSKINEQGGLIGLKTTLFAYSLLGRKLVDLMLYPVILYYYLASKTARSASKQYISKLDKYYNIKIKSFDHFINFGQAILDKLAVWNKDITLDNISFENSDLMLSQINTGKGGVVLTTHMGNAEIARALSRKIPQVKIKGLTYNQHAKKFNKMLSKVNPDFADSIVQIDKLDIDFAINLKEKVDNGEFIVIAADRTSVTNTQRAIDVNFLGESAKLPEGVFILAGLLRCPVYFMACMKDENKHFHIIFDKLAECFDISRKHRKANLHDYAHEYTKRLELLCKKYPLQWFNFFDFWK